MKKKIPFIIIFSINIILLGYILIQKTAQSKIIDSGETESIQNLSKRMSLEDVSVFPYIQLVDHLCDTVLAKDIFSGPPLLVLFYPTKSCKPCAEKILDVLNKEIKTLKIENVILIADFEEIRELAVFARMNKIRFPAYNAIKKSEGFESLFANEPYYAIINNTLVRNYVFFAPNDNPPLTKQYFKIVSSKIKIFN